MQSVTVFWFRRDLRLSDNVGLIGAHRSKYPVLPIFIFDRNILDELEPDDARVSFIHEQLTKINNELAEVGSGVTMVYGDPLEQLAELSVRFDIKQIHTNRDYEPYAQTRDKQVSDWAKSKNIEFKTHKDQVILEAGEVLKDDGNPYTVFTPFKRKWLQTVDVHMVAPVSENDLNWLKHKPNILTISDIGFEKSSITVKEYRLDHLAKYDENRDKPSINGTSNLSPHLRFGTIGIRTIVSNVKNHEAFLSELIWREFFMHILFHFPHVVNNNFRAKYDGIAWRNNKEDFEKWCNGETGYPMVDAGMRELNQTGYMHNRVRMVVASFLCKHLLIDWRWGEAYFAKKLLDFELSSNNGNWQWAAGTGCDAAPYFRVFNPSSQLQKFDPQMKYVRKWVPEVLEPGYARPMVDHAFARKRAIDTYKKGIDQS